MFEIVLFEPEIPPNTGNIIRLCANTGCRLHLIEPLGLWMDHRGVRRAGLDYRDAVDVVLHRDWGAWQTWCGKRRQLVFTTMGTRNYHEMRYKAGDGLVFGSETRGVPDAVLEGFAEHARLRLA